MAINITDLKIDVSCLGDQFILTDVIPMYEYKNNERTDNIEGHRYVVALPQFKFEKIAVRVEDGNIPSIEITEGESKNVYFENLDVSIFYNFNEKKYGVTAKADSISEN